MHLLFLLLAACTGTTPDTDGSSDAAQTDTEVADITDPSSSDSDTETQTDSETESSVTDTDTGPPRDTADRDTPQWDCENRFWFKGDLVLNTAAGVDAFCDTYNAVEGSLTLDLSLNSEDPVQWLDGVACTCEITGDLELFFFNELGGRHASTDLELDNLRTVGGDVYIHEIPGITDITGIGLLESIGGDLRLIDLAGLSQVEFASLETVGGDIEVVDAEEIERLALPALTSVGSLLLGTAGGNEWHWAFEELDLSSLTTVAGSMVLAGLGQLETVEAPMLTTVGEALVLEGGCRADVSMTMLESAGSLEMSGLCGLEDVTGLAGLSALLDGDASPILEARYLDGMTEADLQAWAATLSLPEGAETVVQGSEDGGCDTLMLLTYGRSQEDACSTDTGGS